MFKALVSSVSLSMSSTFSLPRIDDTVIYYFTPTPTSGSVRGTGIWNCRATIRDCVFFSSTYRNYRVICWHIAFFNDSLRLLGSLISRGHYPLVVSCREHSGLTEIAAVAKKGKKRWRGEKKVCCNRRQEM